MVAVRVVPEPEILALQELPTLTAFAVEIVAVQPFTLELPLLLTVISAVKPPPQSLTLTEQPRSPPPEPPLEELELLEDEFEELDEDELEELLLLDELELLEEELLEEELPPPPSQEIPPGLNSPWLLQVSSPIQLEPFS